MPIRINENKSTFQNTNIMFYGTFAAPSQITIVEGAYCYKSLRTTGLDKFKLVSNIRIRAEPKNFPLAKFWLCPSRAVQAHLGVKDRPVSTCNLVGFLRNLL